MQGHAGQVDRPYGGVFTDPNDLDIDHLIFDSLTGGDIVKSCGSAASHAPRKSRLERAVPPQLQLQRAQ